MKARILAFRMTLAIVAGGFVALMVVSLYATELTRFFVDRTAAPPMDLPHGVDIRYSDRLVELIGKGTPGGVATAITLGYVTLCAATRITRSR